MFGNLNRNLKYRPMTLVPIGSKNNLHDIMILHASIYIRNISAMKHI